MMSLYRCCRSFSVGLGRNILVHCDLNRAMNIDNLAGFSKDAMSTTYRLTMLAAVKLLTLFYKTINRIVSCNISSTLLAATMLTLLAVTMNMNECFAVLLTPLASPLKLAQ